MEGNKRNGFYSIVSCVLWWSYFLNDTVNLQKPIRMHSAELQNPSLPKFFLSTFQNPPFKATGTIFVKWHKSPLSLGNISLITVPFLFLEMISQILLREQGSTPVVGSSRITTLDPPRRAIAMDNFLFIPPDRVPASLWRWLYSPVSFKVLQNRGKSCPSSIFSKLEKKFSF